MSAGDEIYLLYGPTASGKSALALGLAARLGGVVVNADALQVYRQWRVLSARPDEDDEAAAEHRLYGHVDLATPDYSVGRWLGEFAAVLADCAARGRPAIVVGGTGLYHMALTEGLAAIPPIPPEIHAAAAARVAAEGPRAVAETLALRDPKTVERIDVANPRRVARALEVLDATGRGLADWAAETPAPLAPIAGSRAGPRAGSDAVVRAAVLEPEPKALAARIEARFRAMLGAGALDEVRAVGRLGLDPKLPGMRAHGRAALAAHLAGAIDLETAAALAVVETRQYAKRQRTFARGRFAGWRRLPLDAAFEVPQPALERWLAER